MKHALTLLIALMLAVWKENKKLAPLAGKTVRLRFVLQEANVFALQFRPGS